MIDVLDIFYKHVIMEASEGRIDCYSYFNILFYTNIVEQGKIIENEFTNENLYIPTLVIKNKREFDRLLVEYVLEALEFYDDINFDDEILNYKEYNDETKICKEKVILTLLWSNATVEDFNNPIDYLKRRIELMKSLSTKTDNLGYSNMLESDIDVEIKKDSIMNETPFMLEIAITDGTFQYILPQVKFGISDNKLYIYAIQNKNTDSNSYIKKIKRKLYKVNESFDSNEDNFSLYEDGNLADITPSTLLAANIAVFYLSKLDIDEVIVPSVLIERWNAKKIALELRASKKGSEYVDEQLKLQDQIQTNITQKLIRTFLRLEYHYQNISIINYPMELDSCLYLKLDDNIICNNKLLEETAILAKKKNKII